MPPRTTPSKKLLTAAANGNVDALYNLGHFFHALIDRNRQGASDEWYNNAIKYYTDAAEKGCESAMFNLAVLYDTWLKPTQAIKWYTDAANHGSVEAMFHLGAYHDKRKESENAVKWYTSAAEKGYVEAMYNLGLLCDNMGRLEEAVTWYGKAAEKGCRESVYQLAVQEENTGDKKKAEKLYGDAAAAGHAGAMAAMGDLHLEWETRTPERSLPRSNNKRRMMVPRKVTLDPQVNQCLSLDDLMSLLIDRCCMVGSRQGHRDA